ncbi:lytic transglycosylase [Marinobacter sp. X15-166B]|uniref:lytic transglycosylase n=1 Tax=Marinobacter sp. X15-166B TaxID=1897620 RepID=UPI00085C8F74|nr:LysM peptidoglycan-binding domain-containing protein [Marinobacter sp. X15-166B]OEY67689.1 lytic transglycosylase [Marinobacter sp. X15-166B]
MTARSLTALLCVGILSSGCSSLRPMLPDWTGTAGEPAEAEVLDSEALQVAAGEGVTDLDDSIAPHMQATARQAREKLDTSTGATSEADTPNDLWDRLRAGFALDHNADNPRVRQQLDWYRKHPAYIARVSERGRRYLHYIVNETEKRGLPGELALLPIVESAFDPFAYSHGRAAGLWQFIPSTGKYFGLTQSWWHDERRDVLAATDAALTYLDRLAKRFDGDYMLALAAYNSGGGTVSKAMRKNRQRNRPTDYWSLQLPRETREYVPKLLALAQIFDNPQAYGIELPTIEDQPFFDVVDTGGQIDLAQAAKLAGVSVDEIYLLNPSYNRWATSPSGPHRLLVPVDNSDRLRSGLAALDPAERVSWQHYKIASGDNLSTIARKFGTTTAVIREVNNLRGDFIRAGQQLLIPTATKGASSYALSESQRLAKTQARGGQRSNGTRIEHLVKPGDTFWDIARSHGVSVRAVAKWNNMAPGDPLIPGQRLVVWSNNATPATLASARDRAMVRRVGYRVRRGDSLTAIANRFSVNVSDIASWNKINTARYLQPGQSLVLYVDVRNSP